MELATESSFKDLVKNRIYYYNEEYTDDAHYGEFSDKCLYCEEDFKREGEVIIENDEDLCENLLQDEIKNQTKPKEPSPISKCPKCGSLFHMTCLALNSIDKGQLIPKVTACLICSRSFPWSEWIK